MPPPPPPTTTTSDHDHDHDTARVLSPSHPPVLDSDSDSASASASASGQRPDLPRTSGEIRRHDWETLTAEEEEAERVLLAGDGGRRRRRRGGEEGEEEEEEEKWERRGRRRRSGMRGTRGREGRGMGEKGEGEGEEEGEGMGELVYAVEEQGARLSSAKGSGRSSGSGSGSGSETDLLQRLGEGRTKTRRRGRRRRKGKQARFAACCRLALVFLFIVVAFVAFLLGAYRATRSSSGTSTASSPAALARVLSNGTHDFAPTTILISLDGFRADFVHRGLTPTLASFIRQGVSPRYMLPSFPSLTFPNHFTLVTGLYPQDHGIVGNTFWDPNMEQEFYYTDPARSMRPEFWNAEPIWETAELQGVRSAIHMWPGSEAHIGDKDPAYVDKFNGDEHLDVKVNRILGWLDMPGADDPGVSVKTPRPQLIAAYVPDVDADGHKYGPNSTYIRSTIAEVDGMLSSLFAGIEDRNLTDIVNVVIVSDHGMATTSNHRLVQLEDLIDTSLIEHIDGWPLYGLRPYDRSDTQLQKLYQQLVDKSQSPEHRGHFDVYLRDENMPARYHFSQNDRIAPLWIVPKVGWAIVTKDEFNIEEALEKDLVYAPRGLHGYDHEHPLMRAIFIARGPAFPHPQGSQVEPFQNIELYNIVCDTLGLEPRPNNGTIRLPFVPSGLHDLENFPELVEEPEEADQVSSQILPPSLPGIENLPPVHSEEQEEPTSDDSQHGDDAAAEKDDHTSTLSKWLAWLDEQYDGAKNWAGGLFGGGKNGTQTAEDIRHGDNW